MYMWTFMHIGTLTIHIHMGKCPKTSTRLGTVFHTCCPSTQDTGGGISTSLRSDWSVWLVSGQPEIHIVTSLVGDASGEVEPKNEAD